VLAASVAVASGREPSEPLPRLAVLFTTAQLKVGFVWRLGVWCVVCGC